MLNRISQTTNYAQAWTTPYILLNTYIKFAIAFVSFYYFIHSKYLGTIDSKLTASYTGFRLILNNRI